MNAAPQPVRRFRPHWTQELLTLYRGRIAQQFVLHFNITDQVIDLSDEEEMPDPVTGDRMPTGSVVGKPRYFREYLHDFLRANMQMEGGLGCQAIYTYSLAGGLLAEETSTGGTPLSTEMRRNIWQRVYDAWSGVRPPQRTSQAGQPQEGQEVALPDKVSDNFKLLGHMLRQRYTANGNPWRDGEQEAPIAVILDYAEKLIPFRLGEGQGDREQLQALETVQRWALDPRIRSTLNVVILLTTNIGQIAASVYAGGSGCRAIRVPLPNMNERRAYIQWRMRTPPFVHLAPADFGADADGQAVMLARSTQGMRLSDIGNLSRRIIVERQRRGVAPVMTMADVQREKAEVIQVQSEQLLEILQPRRGFAEIGGMAQLKEYLGQRTRQMRSGLHTPLVPNGLLLAGPPGTGKTIIAEALATESGFNLVKMRNIREKWVGSSERNLDMVLNLLRDLHPVVVFIDEIDQAMGRRDTGQSGDSGVGARMFGRILEEMSNPFNRGRILWVAATNRADILDEALLRRFDRVIPLLTPDIEEACRIFAAMPIMIQKQSDNAVKVFYSSALIQSGREIPTDADLRPFRGVAEEVVKRGLTGAGIEIIVRRAAEIACEKAVKAGRPVTDNDLPAIELEHLMEAIHDYKPNQNAAMYNYQTLLAIRACNFHSVMPVLPKRDIFERIIGSDGQVSLPALEREIGRLRLMVENPALAADM